MSSDYTIVNVADEAPRSAYNEALSVVLGETPQRGALDARADLKRSIADWADRHDLGLGVYDVVLGTDGDDDVRIILPNLTIDGEGDIVRKTREWTVTARYTVEVQVEVEASSEDEAREEAESVLDGLSFEPEWGEGTVTETAFDGIIDIDEV